LFLLSVWEKVAYSAHFARKILDRLRQKIAELAAILKAMQV
jgi:hypothetical protein